MSVLTWSILALIALTGSFASDEMVARGHGRSWTITCYLALTIGATCTLMAVLGAVG